MFLQVPPDSPYDLKFSLFRIPVRVHPFFWIIGLLIGWENGQLLTTIAFVVCFFISILVHELGHALSARRFGWPPSIVLYAFGGLAFFQPHFGYTRKRAIWIAFAGPLAGFVLGGLAYGIRYWWASSISRGYQWPIEFLDTDFGRLCDRALWWLIWINFFWGLINLLPIHPLDGGKICYEACSARTLRSGQIRAHWVGALTGVLASAWFLTNHVYIAGIMFGGLAYQNFQAQQQLARSR